MKSLIAIVLTLAFTSAVFADGEADFKYRQGVMRTIGGQMTSMAAILRGKVHMENFKIHAHGMAELATIAPHLFPAGSGVDKSEALPAIWDNPDEFKAAMDKFVEAANGISAAADSENPGDIGPAIQALGKACKGCHDNFREEHDD